MDLGLRDARVVVTGAGANIGRGIAQVLAREGARVLVVDIDGEQAGRVAEELPGLGAPDAFALATDLTAEGAGTAVTTAALDAWDGVDVLVNNAGWSRPGWFAEQTDRDLWRRTVEVNLFAAIDCTQAVLGPMREAGRGAVVFLSSDAAYGAVRQGIYGGTKAALISLARTVARRTAGSGSAATSSHRAWSCHRRTSRSARARCGRAARTRCSPRGRRRHRGDPGAAPAHDTDRRRERGRLAGLGDGRVPGHRAGGRRRRRVVDAVTRGPR